MTKPDALLDVARRETELLTQARSAVVEHAEKRREAVRGLRELGMSYGEIARHLDCTRSAVQSILRGGQTG